jgi:hypothetical protein
VVSASYIYRVHCLKSLYTCVTPAHNESGQYCFHSLYEMQMNPNPTVPINVFDEYCTYPYMGITDISINQVVLQRICQQFTTFGCCFANQAAIIAQDQTNASLVKFFPPCLMNYLTTQCNDASKIGFVQNDVPCTAGLGKLASRLRCFVY